MITGPWRSIHHSLGCMGKEQTEKMKMFGDSLHCCSIWGMGMMPCAPAPCTGWVMQEAGEGYLAVVVIKCIKVWG